MAGARRGRPRPPPVRHAARDRVPQRSVVLRAAHRGLRRRRGGRGRPGLAAPARADARAGVRRRRSSRKGTLTRRSHGPVEIGPVPGSRAGRGSYHSSPLISLRDRTAHD
ncbi:MAG TPA: hypothetical protein ENI87_11690 [bacterium]|nr:hypothetical protein [bacterium]